LSGYNVATTDSAFSEFYVSEDLKNITNLRAWKVERLKFVKDFPWKTYRDLYSSKMNRNAFFFNPSVDYE
jgi:hypothetical protein